MKPIVSNGGGDEIKIILGKDMQYGLGVECGISM
jgi:hypothetical protein